MLKYEESQDLLAVRNTMQYLIEYILPFASAAFCAFKLDWFSFSFSSIWPVLLILSAAGLLVRYNTLKLLNLQYFIFSVFNALLVRSALLFVLVISIIVIDHSAIVSFYSIFLFIAYHFVAVFLGTITLLLIGLTPPFRKSPKRLGIVAVTPHALALLEQLANYPFLAIQFEGFFEDRTVDRLPPFGPHRIISRIDHMGEYIKSHPFDHIIISLPSTAFQRMEAALDELLDSTCTVHYLHDFLNFRPIKEHITQFGGVSTYTMIDSPQDEFGRMFKRVFDIISGSVALVLLAPLFIIVAILIKTDSKGPVFFKQKRWGLGGEAFNIYKFRSMTQAASSSDVIVQATKNDMRVTRVGAFLRRSSIDELPQLLNIVKGDMSVVGPRPHVVPQNQEYRGVIRGYMLRHKIKPGLTGWAQIHGFRGETEQIEQMADRVKYDLEYLRLWTPQLDLYIVLKTVSLVIKRTNAY